MQLFTFLENVDPLGRKPAEIHELLKNFLVLSTPPPPAESICSSHPRQPPGRSPSVLHHQLCWSTAKGWDRQARRCKRLSLLGLLSLPSTPTLFLLAMHNPGHLGTSSVLSRFPDFAHAVLEAWNAFPPLILHLQDSYGLCKPAQMSPPLWSLLPYPLLWSAPCSAQTCSSYTTAFGLQRVGVSPMSPAPCAGMTLHLCTEQGSREARGALIFFFFWCS